MKKIFIICFATLSSLSTSACQLGPPKPVDNPNPVGSPNSSILQEYQTAYFASGCFWCVEAVFESVRGVKEAVSGYAGGNTQNPNYQQIGTGRTGHAETVQVFYDPNEVDFKTLVKVFFGSHDPTTLNRQGPDRGTQYRSIAFYQNENEKNVIEDYIQLLTQQQVYKKPVVTEVSPFQKFYKAEDYHQDYEKRNPNHPYVQAVSIPRLNRFKARFPQLLK